MKTSKMEEDEKPRAKLKVDSKVESDNNEKKVGLEEIYTDESEIEPFGDILLDVFADEIEEDELPRSGNKQDDEKRKPVLSYDDIAQYLAIPKDIRSRKSFREELDKDIQLEPQKKYLSHKKFKDFLEFPTIAKDLKKMPTTGYFPKESVKKSEDKISIADKIDIKSEKGRKVSILVHRDFNNDLKLLEIQTNDGDRILISFDDVSTDREKTTEYVPDDSDNPQNFTLDEIESTISPKNVNEEEFKKFANQNRLEDEDYDSLSKKLKGADSVSEDY